MCTWILPCMRMDHKIHNRAHFKSFIDKEKRRERGGCTGLPEGNVVREWGSGHAHYLRPFSQWTQGLCSQVMHRLRRV